MNKISSTRKIICVTGKMASGKNTLCSLLEQNDFLCTDADKVVHKVINDATPKILETFNDNAIQKGITLTNPDGTLNRKNLGELLFQNPTLLKKQEDIIYPLYIEETQKIINSNPSCNIVLNATVLYKTPQLMNQCDFIIFVKSSAIQRFFRVCKRDNIKIKNILQRFYSQKNLYSEYKATNIPIIKIRNSSNMNKLKKQVENLLKKIK